MEIRFLNVGFGNMVAANKIVSIVTAESAPVKRIIQEAKDNGTLINATYGRKSRSVIVMDSGHIVLSAIQPETVANRIDSKDNYISEDTED